MDMWRESRLIKVSFRVVAVLHLHRRFAAVGGGRHAVVGCPRAARLRLEEGLGPVRDRGCGRGGDLTLHHPPVGRAACAAPIGNHIGAGRPSGPHFKSAGPATKSEYLGESFNAA